MKLKDIFQTFIDGILSTNLEDKKEHTDRKYLQDMLTSLANNAEDIVHEPKNDKSGLGAPDFLISKNGCTLGYIENKKIDEDLDKTINSAQIKKYTQLTDNLIITNYIEYIWLYKGEVISRETLCYKTDLQKTKIQNIRR